MTLKSSMLVELLIQPATGQSAGFVPGFFYLTKFVRADGLPIAAVAMRTGSSGEGSVSLALFADDNGSPSKVLYKTELGFPQSKGTDVAATLIAALPQPFYGSGPFWIGFALSAPATLPVRMTGFTGRKTSAQLDANTLGDSLGSAKLEDWDTDEELGMPFLFPIFQGGGA